MANIDINNISDFDINGNSLFEDSEGFMTELSEDNELETIYGGLRSNIRSNNGCAGKTYIICQDPTCLKTVVSFN